MEVMSLTNIVRKWIGRVSIATEEYKDGVTTPRRDWESETAAAETRWADAMREVIAKGLWLAGVRKAGTAKWKEKTLSLGVARWPSGVAAAEDDYRSGFAPYHAVLEALTLPPRYARGDVRNYARSQFVGVALRKRKLEMAA
ncbi:hypothetical protein ES703_19890 [subsurface metagenome]